MAIWSMFSAPLLMSNDLREITDEQKDILLNRHVIEIDQDAAGLMARVVHNSTNVQVFVKHLSQPAGSFAIVYFYRAVLGSAKFVSNRSSFLFFSLSLSLFSFLCILKSVYECVSHTEYYICVCVCLCLLLASLVSSLSSLLHP